MTTPPPLRAGGNMHALQKASLARLLRKRVSTCKLSGNKNCHEVCYSIRSLLKTQVFSYHPQIVICATEDSFYNAV
jgi:hypothetical protein